MWPVDSWTVSLPGADLRNILQLLLGSSRGILREINAQHEPCPWSASPEGVRAGLEQTDKSGCKGRVLTMMALRKQLQILPFLTRFSHPLFHAEELTVFMCLQHSVQLTSRMLFFCDTDHVLS